MMSHPIELLEGVQETVEQLVTEYDVLIVTKGDLLHQEAKVAASGLAELVNGVEVLTEKDAASYRRVLERHVVEPQEFLMVGNSVKSDVLPIVELGGSAAHIPHGYTWEYEDDHDGSPETHGYFVLDSIGAVPELASKLNGRGS